MTESFRRDGEYEQYDNPHQGAQQHASSPVNPEWPPPPAQPPAQPAPAAQHTQPTQPTQPTQQTQPTAPIQQPAAFAAGSYGGSGSYGSGGSYGGDGNGGGTALLTAPPAGPAPAPKRRNRGPLALLAAVAIVAAAIGGGTAYGIQELTGNDTVTSSSTSTSVVPSSAKGTVAGVAKAVSPSIVEINATSNAGESTGSGVIITSNGEIITNNHVISGASSIKVSTNNGKTYTAQVVGTDPKKDLALIKLENASGLTVATLGNSDGVQVGDQVVAIGSPEGLTGTVTSGIVSALNRDVTVSTEEGQQQNQGQGDGRWPFEFGGQQFNGDTGSSTTTYKAIQTDASLNPGNSGGALIDMNGNIIGINSAMYSSTSDSSEAGSQGLGFSIPINTVKSDLATLRAGGTDN
ncbi:S1C family serine protease [Streptomyces griseorubiginosus]|uniref:S1C family serine protease n=1 Tax=Streptomyces griseorubiginosus TaxID=67304 RepID=UPI002E81CB52|nr:trypsin-like peptidase domain-containing protein [Streptomyces griseorubiginosus]WUB46039.1 trypsin-like peptidase domain-containing protein [Streptomyces griseorubiginosus]WUB54560.1 trypsin-like peptidase domain-containing protein [Streptomyces griseorubiginosus]